MPVASDTAQINHGPPRECVGIRRSELNSVRIRRVDHHEVDLLINQSTVGRSCTTSMVHHGLSVREDGGCSELDRRATDDG